MDVEINGKINNGVPLGTVPFGAAVRRAAGGENIFYLVANAMDGTGRRVLVPFRSGSFKFVEQDTPVIVVNATVLVHGDA